MASHTLLKDVNEILFVHFKFFASFGEIRDVHIMLLRTGEFHANWCREGCNSLLYEPFPKLFDFNLISAL